MADVTQIDTAKRKGQYQALAQYDMLPATATEHPRPGPRANEIKEAVRGALSEAGFRCSQPAPAPRKRHSGKSGRNLQPQRQLRAPAAFWALLDRAIEANADGPNVGGYSGWSDWARHHLAIAAADELGIDPMDALSML